jgi:uncharacterized membrane protein
MSELKPGYKTSEGQLAITTTIVTPLVALLATAGYITTEDVEPMAKVIASLVVVLAVAFQQTLITVAYIKSRTDIKVKDLEYEVIPEEAGELG